MSSDQLWELDPSTTALVLVDLQQMTVQAPTVPCSGAEVLANAVRLADGFRAVRALVVLVTVSAGVGGATLLAPPADAAMPTMDLPPGALDLPAQLGPRTGDVVVTKFNWGAFHGTDLDLQLRRRGITTLVLGGIAANYGVESTLRQAHEHGYSQIVASDAVAAFAQEEYDYPTTRIFPRIARVRTTAQVLAALPPPNAG